MRLFLTWKRKKLAGTSWTLGLQFLSPLQALDFNLCASGNVAVDFLLFSTSGLRPIVLREIKPLLSQARELDRIQIPSRSAIRDPKGRDDSSLGLS